MLNVFNKGPLSALLALLTFGALSSSLMAWDCCDPCNNNRLYVGAFGGGIQSGSTKVHQFGTAFFTEENGGPLAVVAKGNIKKNWSGVGGIQVGYEWRNCPTNIGCSGWTLTPAAELEAYFFSHKKKGHLINDTARLPEHDFANSFRASSSVILANIVLSFNNPCGFTPYIGGGIGAANLSLKHATSFQVSPEEVGINHFNTNRNDSAWTFAAQAKVGVRYNICESLHIFGEYRYLFVDSNNYVFGSTKYADHVPTSPWNVKVNSINYNAFVIGLQYDL